MLKFLTGFQMVTPVAGQRWYVAQTQPHAEAIAAAHLRRQGFDSYIPRYRKRRRHAGRTETVARPLFPRYIFVSADLATQRWRSICSTVGVARLVCNGDTPIPVRDAIIDAIRRREDRDGFVCLEQRSRFNAGDRVKILDGAFSTCIGLFEGMADHERVAILLDLLGRKIRLVVDSDSVTAA